MVKIMVKLTKKDKYAMLLEVLVGVEVEDKSMLIDFVEAEVEVLTKKAEKAKGRTRAKKADEMKDVVIASLENELQTGAEILASVLLHFDDATQAKVTARLTALVKEGIAVKEQVKVEGRVLVAYKLA